MHQTIKDCVDQCVISNVTTPLISWQLAYHGRGVLPVLVKGDAAVNETELYIKMCREG